MRRVAANCPARRHKACRCGSRSLDLARLILTFLSARYIKAKEISKKADSSKLKFGFGLAYSFCYDRPEHSSTIQEHSPIIFHRSPTVAEQSSRLAEHSPTVEECSSAVKECSSSLEERSPVFGECSARFREQ